MKVKLLFLTLIGINALFLLSCDNGKSDNFDKTIEKAKKSKFSGCLSVKGNKGELDSICLNEGHLEGNALIFLNGRLVHKSAYSHDSLNGYSYFYFYENGGLKSKSFFRMDHIFGDDISYYENGYYRRYNCFDWAGNNCRIKGYNEKGQLIRDEGLILCNQYWNSKDNIFNANINVVIQILISRAPNEKIFVWTVDKWGKQSYPTDSCVVVYRRKYLPGRYELHIYGVSIDTILNRTKRDTARITLIVK